VQVCCVRVSSLPAPCLHRSTNTVTCAHDAAQSEGSRSCSFRRSTGEAARGSSGTQQALRDFHDAALVHLRAPKRVNRYIPIGDPFKPDHVPSTTSSSSSSSSCCTSCVVLSPASFSRSFGRSTVELHAPSLRTAHDAAWGSRVRVQGLTLARRRGVQALALGSTKRAGHAVRDQER
jgi:hypothetical protein